MNSEGIQVAKVTYTSTRKFSTTEFHSGKTCFLDTFDLPWPATTQDIIGTSGLIIYSSKNSEDGGLHWTIVLFSVPMNQMGVFSNSGVHVCDTTGFDGGPEVVELTASWMIHTTTSLEEATSTSTSPYTMTVKPASTPPSPTPSATSASSIVNVPTAESPTPSTTITNPKIVSVPATSSPMPIPQQEPQQSSAISTAPIIFTLFAGGSPITTSKVGSTTIYTTPPSGSRSPLSTLELLTTISSGGEILGTTTLSLTTISGLSTSPPSPTPTKPSDIILAISTFILLSTISSSGKAVSTAIVSSATLLQTVNWVESVSAISTLAIVSTLSSNGQAVGTSTVGWSTLSETDIVAGPTQEQSAGNGAIIASFAGVSADSTKMS
ncbi:hypothetical protein G7Y89_g9675 [Cudoniella acicularis]|uniref:Uncharacterized protein n=1 Tax=Cudoniella acicularis TaxID=354080 RepID=A0A8H4RGV8_9HELO|nr:hypothetical protein G7Y89_g9675 [Cudoniella acicularis]